MIPFWLSKNVFKISFGHCDDDIRGVLRVRDWKDNVLIFFSWKYSFVHLKIGLSESILELKESAWFLVNGLKSIFGFGIWMNENSLALEKWFRFEESKFGVEM